ncbi:peptide-methionine (S)-S-oxide reductase MsrA [Acidiferrobacter sp.]|jgi:peptide-methionine (S)-S-oxide reductase|uniref:peptide-methionine (S)-S-oxide reductase MsrA n=1 Tax=Acidiferrobacter sp. TaxID=1872107 RepID=UPI00262F5CD5|nr:peptide-methionine (S)-S-oxide reductase MsrA [Acidiferrobacter sp.]
MQDQDTRPPLFGAHSPTESRIETAVLAGGCFWCLEAVFRELHGVLKVDSGYCGGTPDTADYEQVTTGRTDHAEAVRISYDPRQIRYEDLLTVFFSIAHDPTQKDRQGNDRGRQYRSVIFYADESQKTAATAAIEQLTRDQVYKDPIVTEVVAQAPFYPAEAYHNNYAACHPDQPYVAHVAAPKVSKLRRYFAHMLHRAPLS